MASFQGSVYGKPSRLGGDSTPRGTPTMNQRSTSSAQDKQGGLYQLYKEEKKHEERTKEMLEELEQNNVAMHHSKLRLVELLLDVDAKDDMSRAAAAEADEQMHLFAGVSQTGMWRRAQDHLQNQNSVKTTGENPYKDTFLGQLDEFASESDAAARNDMRDQLDQYIKPQVEALNAHRNRDPNPTLASIEKACTEVSQQKKAELAEATTMNKAMDHHERRGRVADARGMFKKNIGNLLPLLYVNPVNVKDPVGTEDAELNDLRTLIAKQREEEEMLLQERENVDATLDEQQDEVRVELDAIQQQLTLSKQEMESKQLDLAEMEAMSQASNQRGVSSWAHSTMQLETDVAKLTEEEFLLRQQADEIHQERDLLAADRELLQAELGASSEEIAGMQEKYNTVNEKINTRMLNDKTRLLRLRKETNSMTNRINAIFSQLSRSKHTLAGQKRDHRAVLNTIISQLSIEDRMQSALMARAQQLQTNMDEARGQAEENITNMSQQLDRLNAEINDRSRDISRLAGEVTNYWAGDGRVDAAQLTAPQLQTVVDSLIKEWSRVEWETSSEVAEQATKADSNNRQNERVLNQLGKYVVLQEDISPAGVDVIGNSTDSLREARNTLYNDASQLTFREANYTQCIRMFRERLDASRAGQGLTPLTAYRPDPSKTAAGSAPPAMSASMAPSVAHMSMSVDRGGSAAGATGNAEHSNWRSMVIAFVKKEIQPLYDTSQITRKRFMDIVARCTTWFTETRRPTGALSAQDQTDLVQKIQEVITWQDEQRLKTRN